MVILFITISGAFFDKYDADTVKGPNYAARIERAAAWLGKDAAVLDIGCASGHITMDLAPHVRSVHGIDVSSKLINIAQRRLEQAEQDSPKQNKSKDADDQDAAAQADRPSNPQISFATNDEMNPALTPGSFDGLTAYAVLHLVDDPQATLHRFHELLKPGGIFISETPCLGDWSKLWRPALAIAQLLGKAPKLHYLKLDQLQQMIQTAGFTLDEVKIYNPKSSQHAFLAHKA